MGFGKNKSNIIISILLYKNHKNRNVTDRMRFSYFKNWFKCLELLFPCWLILNAVLFYQQFQFYRYQDIDSMCELTLSKTLVLVLFLSHPLRSLPEFLQQCVSGRIRFREIDFWQFLLAEFSGRKSFLLLWSDSSLERFFCFGAILPLERFFFLWNDFLFLWNDFLFLWNEFFFMRTIYNNLFFF